MSNLSDKSEKPNKTSISTSTSEGTELRLSPKKQRWSAIKSDLQMALDEWAELDSRQPPLSPDEEQLVKIKSIIGQLKEKLENF